MTTNTTPSMSRRKLLTSMPAAAAALAPATATALGRMPADGADPIFAAIEVHKKAMQALSAAYSAQGETEEDSPEIDDANDRHEDALFDFLTTAPVTLAGAIAALDYAASPMFPDQKGANNRETLQLAATMAGDKDFVEVGAQFPAMIAATLRKLPRAQS